MGAKLIAGVLTPVVVILVLSVVCAICCIRRRRRMLPFEYKIDMDNPSVSSQQPQRPNEIPSNNSSISSQQPRRPNEIPSSVTGSINGAATKINTSKESIDRVRHVQGSINEEAPKNPNKERNHEDNPSVSSQQPWRPNEIPSTHVTGSINGAGTKINPNKESIDRVRHAQGSINEGAPKNPNKERKHEDKHPSIPQHQQQDTNPLTSRYVCSHELFQPHTPAIGPVIPEIFTYEDLREATNNFSKDNLLGSGGFGPVHKGSLKDGTKVVIKQLKPGGEQGDQEFRTEVITLSSCCHKHLVKLVGYCISGTERLVVYEFVPNKSLKSHLHGNDEPVLDWQKRFNIARGTAKGLVYLHECPDGKTKIIHRDIKSENILLDENFEAKVADFGLARLFANDDTHVSTKPKGTFGYLDPDYYAYGHLTEKSDVYSFGMLLLELITGRKPRGDLALEAKEMLTKAVEVNNFVFVDQKLGKEYDNGEMFRMVHCAAACVCYSIKDRPEMSQILEALEGNLDVRVLTRRIETRSNLINLLDNNEEFRKEVEEIAK